MAILRTFTQLNTVGAALTSANTPPITIGEDYSFKFVSRVFAAADIGNAAGQTQNANGAIVATFSGAIIKGIVNLDVYRPNGVWNMLIENIYPTGALGNFMSLSWQIVNNTSANTSTLLIRDGAAGAPGQLAANDFIQALVVLGNQ